jgi:hypothetical protein
MPSTRQDLIPLGKVDSEGIHAVHAPGPDTEAGATSRQPRFAGYVGNMGRDGVEIVFDVKAQRQAPSSSQIERLQRGPDI